MHPHGLESEALERWMSGLSHTPGKRAWGKTHRGFESRLLRQMTNPVMRLSVTGFFVVYANPVNSVNAVNVVNTVNVRICNV